MEMLDGETSQPDSVAVSSRFLVVAVEQRQLKNGLAITLRMRDGVAVSPSTVAELKEPCTTGQHNTTLAS